MGVMTIRVSRDAGRSWGRQRRFRAGTPLVTTTWPPCRCPGCSAAAASSASATRAEGAVAAITQAARAEATRCPHCRQERRVFGSEVAQGSYRPVVVTGTCACSDAAGGGHPA